MKTQPVRRFAAVIVSHLLLLGLSADAQNSVALRASLFNPSTNAQRNARQGSTVAVDNNWVAVGTPYCDSGATDSGSVKVYDASTGGLLHTLKHPVPGHWGTFGYSVALSGARLVVGAVSLSASYPFEITAYVYDLAGATPTTPVYALPSSEWESGYLPAPAVAISGDRVVVGLFMDRANVNGAGAAYVFDLVGANPLVPILTLTNPTGGRYDAFGYAVAIDGNRVVIGAPNAFGGTSYHGLSYVYELAETEPGVPFLTLTNPLPGTSGFFGGSVGISGGRIVVGAQYDDTTGQDDGAAFVYDLDGATPTIPSLWLAPSHPEPGDRFGIAVSISGHRVVVGASAADPGDFYAGSAFLFDLDGVAPSTPSLVLTNPQPTPAAAFGFAAAISGTRIVVGVPDDDVGEWATGRAWLYDTAGPNPALPVSSLASPVPATEEHFGQAVAVFGTRVVVGALHDGTGSWGSGVVHVYDFASTTPAIPILTLTNPTPEWSDEFGAAVAMAGTRVVVSAPADDTFGQDAGIVWVYDLAGATPTVPLLSMSEPDAGPDARFGSSLALSREHLLVAAHATYRSPSGGGVVYVYDLAGATPAIPVLTLKNPASDSPDHFGAAMSISGVRVVIGAPNNSAGGPWVGLAYVYDLASASPDTPWLTLTHPTLAPQSHFGMALGIDGSLVVVGAPQEDAHTSRAGTIHLFDLAGSTPGIAFLSITNPAPRAEDDFGAAVAISGSRVVAGAPGLFAEHQLAGPSYVFDIRGAQPRMPIAVLTNPTPAIFEHHGASVAIEETTIVIGAPREGVVASSRGAAYIYAVGPALRLNESVPGLATLSWTPTNSPGFVLQYAESLAPAHWENAPNGAMNPVTISTTNGGRLYRLAQP